MDSVYLGLSAAIGFCRDTQYKAACTVSLVHPRGVGSEPPAATTAFGSFLPVDFKSHPNVELMLFH